MNGIQKETTILNLPRIANTGQAPCLTLRENTERPVTVTQRTNMVVGCDPRRIVAEALAILNGGGKGGQMPELWDGQAARRRPFDGVYPERERRTQGKRSRRRRCRAVKGGRGNPLAAGGVATPGFVRTLNALVMPLEYCPSEQQAQSL